MGTKKLTKGAKTKHLNAKIEAAVRPTSINSIFYRYIFRGFLTTNFKPLNRFPTYQTTYA